MAPDAAPPPSDTILGILIEAVRHAPPKARRALWANLAAMLFVVGVALIDLVSGTQGQEGYRLAGFILGMTGISMLAMTLVLHHASQQGSADCRRVSFFRLRSQVMDRIFVVLPVMAGIAAVFLAVAIGLFVPAVIARPYFVIAIVWFAAELVVAVRALAHTTRFMYEHAERQVAAAERAHTEAAEAQLTALQAQMNPHFLFNALNTVASLVRTDARAAERTVENLSDVLRRTLDRSRVPMSTVRDEVDFLRAYLAIEQERWGDRLHVDWHVDPAALSAQLPPMTLQPLVENALKHGLGNRLEGGELRIEATRANGRLRLCVSDNGAGFAPGFAERTGLGNLRARLATLYGAESALRIDPNGVGTTVVVEIPVTQSEE